MFGGTENAGEGGNGGEGTWGEVREGEGTGGEEEEENVSTEASIERVAVRERASEGCGGRYGPARNIVAVSGSERERWREVGRTHVGRLESG